MNSVSTPRRPPSRASSASSRTTSADTVVEAMTRHPTGELPRPARLRRMLTEEEAGGVWGGLALGPGDRHASVEHVVPRLKGGPAWPENEVVACRACNRARGHATPVAWLRACEERGLQPDRARVARKLLELHADRKSTRLNSSHANISYAVFCL